MNRIEQVLCERPEARHGALLPYFTSGFPNQEAVAELIRRADAMGAAVVELGVPYSDSIADGPVIQDSFYQSLARGHSIEDLFNLAATVRPSVQCGLVAMVSFSIVCRYGVDRFVDRAVDVGFDGIITPEVPVEESQPLLEATQRVGLSYIGLVAPTTPRDRWERIAGSSSGFVYRIAVSGTTGERQSLPPTLKEEVAQLRAAGKLPVCVGFGVSTPEQVAAVCEISDGAIVGSALIRRISDGIKAGYSTGQLVESVTSFLEQLMAAADARSPSE